MSWYLCRNFSSKKLQGPFPAAIGNLTDLNEIDLQYNNFTGSIPASLSALKHLLKLSVNCNPFLNNQPPDGLSTGVDFSHGGCAPKEYQSPPAVASQRIFLISGVAGGSLACTFALGLFFVCFNKRERCPPKTDCSSTTNAVFQECSIHKTTNPAVQQLSLKSIQTATGNFKTLIGEGGFGAVYRGTLAHGQEVAVKVRSSISTQGTREFNNELRLLSAVWHENLVPLIGYCCEKDQQILVYPFMSNGSLQDRLYGEASKRKVLDWPTRLSVVLVLLEGWYTCTILLGVVSYTEMLNQATYFWITACVAR
uniref:SYMRK n=1 Tax=Arundo donax TaxID=35708 RepID=A0A0A9HH86_ARUDO